MKRWWNVSYSHSSTVYWHCFIPWCRPMVLFSSVHSSLSNPSPDYHGTDPRWQSIDHQMTKYRSPESRVQIVRWLGTDHQMTKYRSLESRVQITREADEEPELLRLAQGRVQKKINHPDYIKTHTQKYPEISENFWSLSLRIRKLDWKMFIFLFVCLFVYIFVCFLL